MNIQNSRKNNVLINNLDNYTSNNKPNFQSLNNKFKRAYSQDLLFKNYKKLKNDIKNFNISNNKKKVIFRNTFLKKSKSKLLLKDYNAYIDYHNHEITNVLLNYYPNIEKHRKIKFTQEIKDIVKTMKKETNSQNNKIVFSYNAKNPMTPCKITTNHNKYSIPYLNNENIYKFNIMAKSKILTINDIQLNNINNFFNTEKFDYEKRSSSLENLNKAMGTKTLKYISDMYYNNKIKKHGVKIYNYKSPKLREVYDDLKQ